MAVLGIKSNIIALNAQRRLGQATSSLSESQNRLSSGLRITKASDDAAGLAVASRLNLDTQVSKQAIRNLNDGVSYLSSVDSALGELSGIATRIKEIAEQSANGTLGSSQRVVLQQEVTALQDEYNRIATSTKFNSKQTLTGENTNINLQGGTGPDAQLKIQVGASSLGIQNDLTRAGLTTLVNTDSSGAVGNSNSDVQAISDDGRYVLFNSTATNLVIGDTNGQSDSFIKDTVTGITTRVSTDSTGVEANAESSASGLSSDGRYVLFDSSATNLVAGDTNGATDTFIKDTVTGLTTRVSTDSAGAEANDYSSSTAISSDGRYVLFESFATNLVAGDTNGATDTFIKDTITGITTRVSTDSSGGQISNSSRPVDITPDGRYVTFYSLSSDLVSGDTNATRDAFVKDTVSGITTRISTDSSGGEGNANSYVGDISDDGRYVSFESSATNLVSGDANGMHDVFIKDTITGVTSLISTDSNGNQANNYSTVGAISSDGRYVVFNSLASNLVEGDTNGTVDSFIKDTKTGVTRRISTDSNGNQLTGESYVAAITVDGRYAVFANDTGLDKSYRRDLSTTGIQQISGMVVSNQVSAKITLGLSEKYQEEILSYRASIGAGQSRSSTFINTLRSAVENYTSASSKITDVDVAEETVEMVAAKILQNAAGAVQAQANQQPFLVLQLLS